MMACGGRVAAALCVLLAAAAATDDAPPGLVATDSDQDLLAEATHNGAAQKREAPPAPLSNSYGEPLPPDVYGPPAPILQHQELAISLPVPVYGVPDHTSNQIQYPAPPPDIPPPPPGAYGPPQPLPAPAPNAAPVYGPPDFNLQEIFGNNLYEGPPPPIFKPKPNYGPPKQQYGPPKQEYGPPKQQYGPPKQQYGPPKQQYGPPKPIKSYGPPKQGFSLPKPQYGPPFKSRAPIKFSAPKPQYGPPKIQYGPPKPVYGPPKPIYGVPKPSPPSLQYGTPIVIPEFQALPAPVYGPPLTGLPLDLKPNFPIPSDSYGPPGLPLPPGNGLEQLELGVQYGPPQPDPNPRPPHPGAPAPPTPPHVLYDGWRPMPGVSHPPQQDNHQHNEHHQQIVQQNYQQNLDQYGPPPPPPPSADLHLDNNVDLSGTALPHAAPPPIFFQGHGGNSGGHIEIHSGGQSGGSFGSHSGGHSVGNFDSHSGGHSGGNFDSHAGGHSGGNFDSHSGGHSGGNFDSHSGGHSGGNFDSHSGGHSGGYSGGNSAGHSVHADALANIDLSFLGAGGDNNHIDQANTVFEAHYTERAPSAPQDSYGIPPPQNGGPYPAPRQPHHLPLAYGVPSGSTGGHSYHTGGAPPKRPIAFRDPVPQGLIQEIGQAVNQKDAHGIDHQGQGNTYISPPVRELKDVHQHIGGPNVQVSIEPSHLFSLPHAGSPLLFNGPGQIQLSAPSGSYGSPIDSYAAPLLSVSDASVAASNQNVITASADGKVISDLEAAAILKHCPYHEAILKAAAEGGKVPAELAASYVASLSSLGNSLTDGRRAPPNAFSTPLADSESVNYNSQDLAIASNTLVHSSLPVDNAIKSDQKTEKVSVQKGKSLKGDSKETVRDERIKTVSEQIQETSEKIKNLSAEAKSIQQKIKQASQGIETESSNEIPIRGTHGTYTLQIQAAGGTPGTGGPGHAPHEQLLSEGLLQSILQAIEQPEQARQQARHPNQHFQLQQSPNLDLSSLDIGGLTLPAGYEPVDRSKHAPTQAPVTADQEVQSSNSNIQQILNNEVVHTRGDMAAPCDSVNSQSIQHVVVHPGPDFSSTTELADRLSDVDNDVAVFFDQERREEPVTEISVATSISEGDGSDNAPKFGDKLPEKRVN